MKSKPLSTQVAPPRAKKNNKNKALDGQTGPQRPIHPTRTREKDFDEFRKHLLACMTETEKHRIAASSDPSIIKALLDLVFGGHLVLRDDLKRRYSKFPDGEFIAAFSSIQISVQLFRIALTWFEKTKPRGLGSRSKAKAVDRNNISRDFNGAWSAIQKVMTSLLCQKWVNPEVVRATLDAAKALVIAQAQFEAAVLVGKSKWERERTAYRRLVGYMDKSEAHRRVSWLLRELQAEGLKLTPEASLWADRVRKSIPVKYATKPKATDSPKSPKPAAEAIAALNVSAKEIARGILENRRTQRA